ncbi:hypothetical protein EYZ11_007776 [Aspergillus tanneri]|uniref:Spindle pole body component n=1 Tax=Aspergillus tanneri TaxID=1220188 RepID=A0A4S3JEE8_9EURO|nr:hypothetical protein EYZ11_007776 [Aspergillus tanneri]
MLHEVLLSLSGQPSPLFNPSAEEGAVAEDAFPLLSPPEKALLRPLARLSRLHPRLRAHTALISSSHSSVICRAVSTAISAQHLGGFQKKILEVEKAILVDDSGYVGASLIDYLRAESQTGYVDIEEMALNLVRAAETAWMRQLSTWLLYGNLPVLGKDDFFVQEDNTSDDKHSSNMVNFVLHAGLLPKFVSPHTASSILFIGKTLNLIRAKRGASTAGSPTRLATTPVTLHGDHIEHLAALESPISTSKLSAAVDSIRLSLSQSTFSKLLPLQKILEILSVLHDFLLLRRGEFATALVSQADVRLHDRRRKPEFLGPQDRPTGVLQGLAIKEGDVMAALSQTWAELHSLQNEEDPQDDELELARDLLRLSVSNTRDNGAIGSSSGTTEPEQVTGISSISFDGLLFPVPTSLSVQVCPPLDLFLSVSDISTYSKMHSYLLGIRRAQIHLGDLWKHTFLRKNYPSPWGPPRSSTPFGQNKLKMGRERDNARIRQMRPIWATSSASLFVLSEIGSFFQGEVINGSWQHFLEWIKQGPTSPSLFLGPRPGTASSSKNADAGVPGKIAETGFEGASQPAIQRHDPETLTLAHRRYIFSLVQSLFLTDIPFTKALRLLLTGVDHFIELVVRLEGIQRNMDLETDEGVVDALVDYAREEREIWQALGTARSRVDAEIKNVVARLRDIDDSRSGEGQKMFDVAKSQNGHWPAPRQNYTGAESTVCHYVPRKAAGVDQLLMKLDFGNANGSI